MAAGHWKNERKSIVLGWRGGDLGSPRSRAPPSFAPAPPHLLAARPALTTGRDSPPQPPSFRSTLSTLFLNLRNTVLARAGLWAGHPNPHQTKLRTVHQARVFQGTPASGVALHPSPGAWVPSNTHSPARPNCTLSALKNTIPTRSKTTVSRRPSSFSQRRRLLPSIAKTPPFTSVGLCSCLSHYGTNASLETYVDHAPRPPTRYLILSCDTANHLASSRFYDACLKAMDKMKAASSLMLPKKFRSVREKHGHRRNRSSESGGKVCGQHPPRQLDQSELTSIRFDR